MNFSLVAVIALLVLGGCSTQVPKKSYQGYEGPRVSGEKLAILRWDNFFDIECRLGRLSHSQYVVKIDTIEMTTLYEYCGGKFETCCGDEYGFYEYSVELLPGPHRIKYLADFNDGKTFTRRPRTVSIELDMKADHVYKIDRKRRGFGPAQIFVVVRDETTGSIICDESKHSTNNDSQSNCTISE